MKVERETGGALRIRLVDELNYQNISHKAFAAKVGISMSTLNMYLYRNSMPSADIIVKMARALHTTAEYLVTGERTVGDAFGRKQLWQRQAVINVLDTLTEAQLGSFLKVAQAFSEAVAGSA